MLFPNLEHINLSEGENKYDNGELESYTGIILDPEKNQFKVVTGKYEDKKDMYEKLFAQGYVLRKCFETRIWQWIEDNAPDDITAYLMYSTAFSKWKGNNMLGEYYVKLLKDLPDITREGSKGNPGTKGKNSIRKKHIEHESVEESVDLIEKRTGYEKSFVVRFIGCNEDKKPIGSFEMSLKVDPDILNLAKKNTEYDVNKIISKDDILMKSLKDYIIGEEGLMQPQYPGGVYAVIFDENGKNITEPSFFNAQKIESLYRNSLNQQNKELRPGKPRDNLKVINLAIEEIEKTPEDERTNDQKDQLESLYVLRKKFSKDSVEPNQREKDIYDLIGLIRLENADTLYDLANNDKQIKLDIDKVKKLTPDTKGLLLGYDNIDALKVARDNGEISISNDRLNKIESVLQQSKALKIYKNDLITLNNNAKELSHSYNDIHSNVLQQEYNGKSYNDLSHEEQNEFKLKKLEAQKEYMDRLIKNTGYYSYIEGNKLKVSYDLKNEIFELLSKEKSAERSYAKKEKYHSPESQEDRKEELRNDISSRGDVNTYNPKTGSGHREDEFFDRIEKQDKLAKQLGIKNDGSNAEIINSLSRTTPPARTKTPEEELMRAKIRSDGFKTEAEKNIASDNMELLRLFDLYMNGDTSEKTNRWIKYYRDRIDRNYKIIDVASRDYNTEDELKKAIEQIDMNEAYVNDNVDMIDNPSPFNKDGLQNIPGSIVPLTGEVISEDTTNSELNKDLFDGDMLKPNVCDTLLKIAHIFKEKLDLPFEPIDVYLTGSMANYNYNEYSDIDVHLIYDYENVGINADLLNKYVKTAKLNFNKNHNITLYSHPVELGVENSNEPLITSGVYSLLNNQWVKKPTNKSFEFNGLDKEHYIAIKQFVNLIIDNNDLRQIKNILKTLRQIRKNSLKCNGEFGFGNLLYKALRSEGVIDKLQEKYYNLEDKKMSI